jgi:hypothetical protein
MLEFRRQDRERVVRGEITVTYRLWKSARVKAGQRYATRVGPIDVLDVRLLPAGMIGEDDVGPSGCADIAAIWALAGEHTGAVVGPETLLWRVEFRVVASRERPDGDDDATNA